MFSPERFFTRIFAHSSCYLLPYLKFGSRLRIFLFFTLIKKHASNS